MAVEIVVNRADVRGSTIKEGQVGREVLVLQDTQHMVSGITIVHPHCQTRGHAHPEREEHYYVLSGSGYVLLGDERYDINVGDCIYIPPVSVHTIVNTTGKPLEFFWAAFPDEPKIVSEEEIE